MPSGSCRGGPLPAVEGLLAQPLDASHAREAPSDPVLLAWSPELIMDVPAPSN